MNNTQYTVERSLKDLIGFLDVDNIAEELDDHELRAIGNQVKEDFEADQTSMEDWAKLTEQGLDLVSPPTEYRDEPWEQAANFKFPGLQEAAYRFGERASTELLRPKELVKSETIGSDPDGAKGAQGDRVSTYMSYQINHEIPEWRDEERSLLYRLPNMGTVWKKTYYDPIKEHIVSDLIQYPSFTINQNTTTLEDLACFTHIIELNKNEIHSLQSMGLWLDIKLPLHTGAEDQDDSDSHDSPSKFLEQQTFYDLDGDGYEEPYIITTHQSSSKVVCIKPRFKLSDVLVTDGNTPVTLDTVYGDLIEDGVPVGDDEGEIKQGLREEIGQDEDGNPVYRKVSQGTYDIVKISPERNLTAYRFMPSADGTFLGVGYYQLLSALVSGINAITNQLINAGTLNNQQSGYLAKGMRKRLGNDRFKPGELKETNVAGQDLMNGILYHDFKEPSNVLLQLTQDMRGIIKDVTSAADLAEIVGTNTAASTVLMMLEEAQASTTSLMSEQARSMGKEFQIIYALNATYTDPQVYQDILQSPEADYAADFAPGNLDMLPTANPEMANKSQRIQQGQILNDNFERLVQAGADPAAIERRFLESLGIDNIDELMPPPTEEFMAAQTKAQEAQAQASESQARLSEAQAMALEANAKEMVVNAKIKEAKLPDEIEKLKAETIKNLEQAESEQSTNQIDVYTSQIKQIEGIERLIATIGAAQGANPQSPVAGASAPTAFGAASNARAA